MTPAEAGIDRALAALADPARRRAVDILRHGPVRAGELARRLALAPPAMSKHLRILRQGRIIEEVAVAEDARARLYRLRPEPFEELEGWLQAVAGYWTDQLDAFRTHVATQARDGARDGE